MLIKFEWEAFRALFSENSALYRMAGFSSNILIKRPYAANSTGLRLQHQ